MTFVYGILGLGLIILIHETGHLIAAKIAGVTVEAFSIGMGPVLLHKTIKGTDFRLSLIPLGGYCGMKGEKAFQDALNNNEDHISGDADSFYGVHPLKRAFIAFSGPFFNVLFAVVAFTVISMIGYDFYSADNRIVIATEVYDDLASPAKEAGLLTGDKIISIDGKDTPYFSDISQCVASSPDQTLRIEVERNGSLHTFYVTSSLDKSTGTGKIGIMNWIDPVIAQVDEGSPAFQAGLQEGDIITSIDGNEIDNLSTLQKVIKDGKGTYNFQYRRGQELLSCIIKLEEGEDSGIYFRTEKHHTPTYSFFPAIWQGIKETADLTGLTIKSIGLLFKGIDLTQAVSGPARITKMIGETAEAGFKAGFSTGLVSLLNFLSLISISLFIMNLLPIPILDGGLILFALIEFARRRQIKPKVLYYVQFIGIGIIILLFVIALFSDINYFVHNAAG
ncbi:MAG: RIP metalloprotease RseP [Treponemataceae bacterium]|nr:RIP metalloprotease RseP [Treponemataceae bacterium]